MANSETTKSKIKKRRQKRAEKNHKQNQKAKSWAKEWIDAIVFAAVAALIIRAFFFEAYRIPTPSMEKTLMTGDFLVVSKIAYGPRTPMSVCVPFTNICIPGFQLPWARIPGYEDVDRNDIVVFNYPIDIAVTSQKTNYIKRCVGLPGDELKIDDKILYVNGERAEPFDTFQRHHVVKVKERVRLSPSKVSGAGGRILTTQGNDTYIINMTHELADQMENWQEVKSVSYYVLPDSYKEFSRSRFSFSSGFTNHDHLPPITVPKAGDTITLTPENWHVYRNIVVRYENNDVEKNGDSFVINGEETNMYTIKQNYYFMMGDNRDNSEDSRFWGFVPQTHIIGKAALIYFSWDSQRLMPRFNRILNLIHDW